MRAKALSTFSAGSEIVSIGYEPGRLVIKLGSDEVILFDTVVGFRVLDEGDLLEFWPHCSNPAGGLFEVFEGGWLSQESTRPGFVSALSRAGLREFLVTGVDDCVSVLSLAEPRLELAAAGRS